ncbi:MAG: helix-turn-helix domain-containing protein [Ktedonobacteraceae bacterium]|nr:helix-turn-helix domain-containing protein [Ktedonobacteraceae bacterium]
MKANQRLKRERELRGWSQAKVAMEIGTDPATIGRWERGLSFPYPYFREKLCVLFGKSAPELGLMRNKDESKEGYHSVDYAGQISAPLQIHDPFVPLLTTISSGLIGRDCLLSELKQRLLSGGDVALTALNGLPGVGKTALATQLSHDDDVRAHFCDGVLWAALGPHPHILSQLGRWGALLNISSHELADQSCEAWSTAIRSAIGFRRFLLVIDDAWTIDDALICKVGGPNCAYLVTTRLPQIALYFAGNGVTVVHELSEDDSVALLARLIPDVVLNEALAIRQLVHSVGGLPLALTLIGKHLRAQSHSRQPRRIKAALERLKDMTERLQLNEPYALVERHPSLMQGASLSLRSVIAVSDQALDAQARTALHALAVFPAKPNSFSEEAAEVVSAQPASILDILSDAGILESSGPGRYALHRTISDYALAHALNSEAYERFVMYFVDYIEKYKRNYEALNLEFENILAALQVADEQNMHTELIRGVNALSAFLHTPEAGNHPYTDRARAWLDSLPYAL